MNLTHEITQFSSAYSGPHILIMGAIHGNEVCGAHAIKKAMKLIQEGEWLLKCGTVTFLPVCNPDAFEKGVREVSVNLNRVIKPHHNPELYEEKLACSIVSLIDKCDYLLDIHSFHTEGMPFVFQDYEDGETKSFVSSLGVDHLIKGWGQMFATVSDDDVSDTVTFAHSRGKVGAVIECGAHADPKNVDVALNAIKGVLGHLGIIDKDCSKPNKPCLSIEGKKVVYKKKEGSFAKPWCNLDSVKEGELIATYQDGSTEIAPHDGVLILPFSKAKLGDEWFYYGVPCESY